jgi:hypothetical protein
MIGPICFAANSKHRSNKCAFAVEVQTSEVLAAWTLKNVECVSDRPKIEIMVTSFVKSMSSVFNKRIVDVVVRLFAHTAFHWLIKNNRCIHWCINKFSVLSFLSIISDVGF